MLKNVARFTFQTLTQKGLKQGLLFKMLIYVAGIYLKAGNFSALRITSKHIKKYVVPKGLKKTVECFFYQY